MSPEIGDREKPLRAVEKVSVKEIPVFVDPRKRQQDLKDLFSRLEKKTEFKVGDIVKWKAGLKNKRVPQYDEPAIVAEVLDPPLIGDLSETGSAYYREPLTLVLGVIDPDGDFSLFHYDGRRFESYAQP